MIPAPNGKEVVSGEYMNCKYVATPTDMLNVFDNRLYEYRYTMPNGYEVVELSAWDSNKIEHDIECQLKWAEYRERLKQMPEDHSRIGSHISPSYRKIWLRNNYIPREARKRIHEEWMKALLTPKKQFMQNLTKIQNELKAPKSQRNDFGKYNYRNCEDIMNAVKPLLDKYNLQLIVSDSIELCGDRVYIKSTATLFDGNDKLEVTAYAREAESKKGMDESQITGTASSYARKYALCGLFLIDGSKDADALNKSEEYTQKTQHVAQATNNIVVDDKLIGLAKDFLINNERSVQFFRSQYNVANYRTIDDFEPHMAEIAEYLRRNKRI